MKGKDKLPILLAEKGQKLIKQLVPQIIQIAEKTGIKNIGEITEELPNFCLTKDELNKILDVRNNLVDKLNSTTKIINTLSKTTNTLNNVINVTSIAVTTLNIARLASNVGVAAIPSPPGAPGAIVSSLNTLKDLLEFMSPKITTTKNIISSVNTSVDFVNSILLKLLNLLKSIDKYLIGCNNADNLISFSEYILNLEKTYIQNQNQLNPNLSTYQGFILEVIQEQFSPTIKRSRAIAKNSQGIILLKTPLSFTSTPQVLIEELKLIIDSNNLKAN